jgi:ATP-grasp domain, R2K clade family 3
VAAARRHISDRPLWRYDKLQPALRRIPNTWRAIAFAYEVARRIGAPFLVIDVAQTIEGKWIAIECNNGQESGYGGVSPIGLWNNLVDFERGVSTHEA